VNDSARSRRIETESLIRACFCASL
jgi:translation initiation factor 3 subunit B